MIDFTFILFTTGMIMILVVRAVVMDRMIPWFSPQRLAEAALASATWLIGSFPSLRAVVGGQPSPVEPAAEPGARPGWRARATTALHQGSVSGQRAKAKPGRSWRASAGTNLDREQQRRSNGAAKPGRPSEARAAGGWRQRILQDPFKRRTH